MNSVASPFSTLNPYRAAQSSAAFFVPIISLIAASSIEPVNSLEIDEVVRLLRILQRKLGVTAPTIGLRPEVSNLRDNTTQKPRHAGGDFLRHNPVHVGMSLVAPPERALGLQKE
jgi:hypothetical protein